MELESEEENSEDDYVPGNFVFFIPPLMILYRILILFF